MAMQIQITTNALQLRDTLGRIRAGLPKAAGKDIKAITKIYSRAFASEIKNRGLIFSGNLYDSARRIRKTKKGYTINVLRYGLNLGLMKRDHKVGPDTKGRESFDAWMIQKTGSTRPYLTVRALKRHMWVNPGLKVAKKRVLAYFENTRIQRLFTSKGMMR